MFDLSAKLARRIEIDTRLTDRISHQRLRDVGFRQTQFAAAKRRSSAMRRSRRDIRELVFA